MRLLLLLSYACALAAQTGAPAANPFLGSWRLNVKESQLPGPPPADYTSVRIYEERGGLLLHTIVYSWGKGWGFTFAAVHYDGKEVPVFDSGTLGAYLSNGTKPPGTVFFHRTDPRVLEYTDKQDGRVSGKGICTVSPDGRKLTESVTNFDQDGKEIRFVLVYDKQ